MRRGRYHILVLHEDGKQYHNRILEWFQVKRNLWVIGTAVGLLLLGNIGFVVLAGWHGSVLARARALRQQKAAIELQFTRMSQSLGDAQQRLSDSERKLAQMQELARQQNLQLPKVAGLGGPVASLEKPFAPPATVPGGDGLASQITGFSHEVDEVANATDNLVGVLAPHLDSLAHTPSIWPVKGFLSSGFGQREDPVDGEAAFHTGVDISAPFGSPVQAPADGLVVETGWQQGYGNCIVISHGNGVATLYGHLSKILVETGQKVKRWQKIGLVGQSGRATGAHLHYEVHRQGRAVNPKPYLIY
jgi:murein DD-endopeptidase MepM/ murein hydrolase activator NlpD